MRVYILKILVDLTDCLFLLKKRTIAKNKVMENNKVIQYDFILHKKSSNVFFYWMRHNY